VAGGHPADVTRLVIRNLVGNVSEWVSDRYARYDEACWHPELRLLEDPRCDEGSTQSQGKHLARGAGWDSPLGFAKVTMRHPVLTDAQVPNIGFRCARSALPGNL
jgi:formylglycine-generating enzyme required for sulfatase activity